MIVSYFMRYNNENDIREGSIRQLNRKKNKNSNAGMTLLEVIVAVSIFSITAIVLLQSFVTSSRINRKSNTYLEATTVAQNVMEEIKAKRFQEVALAFNYPIDLTTSSSRFLKSRIILWKLRKSRKMMMVNIPMCENIIQQTGTMIQKLLHQ